MAERYERKTATIVGVLFIIATVASMATLPLIGSAFEDPDYILSLSDIEGDVVLTALLNIVLIISVAGIGALMFPVLRKHAEGLGTLYVGIRLMEAIFIGFSVVCLLVMLSMSQDYAMGDLDQASNGTMGALLFSLYDRSLLFGTLIFLSIGGLVLNYVLYRSRLVPRWLSAWGLFADVCILIYGVMGLFGTDASSFDYMTLLALPILVQEMVFAVRLIIKGFDAPSNVKEESTE